MCAEDLGARRHFLGKPSFWAKSMRNMRDIIGGGLLLASGMIGLFIAAGYDLGTPRRMGAGAYPLLVSGALTMVSLVVVSRAVLRPAEGALSFAVRPALAILGSLMAFAIVMPFFGLIPAAAISVVVASLGQRHANPIHIALLALGVSLACWLVFVVGLKLPLAALRSPL